MAYLIDIACEVTDYLDVDNTELHASSFEDFQSDRPFDVVLSFANHSTYDGQTKNTLDEYFDKCHRSCADDGLLLFESHPPAYEGDGLDAAVNVIEGRFTILERHVLEYGGFLDRGRTFIVARKR